MNYLNVKNPIWADKENTSIKCMVTFEGIGEVPFLADPKDTINPNSKVIFDECVSEKWGYISDYVEAPKPEPHIPTEEQNKVKASQLLRETDFVELPSVSDPGEPLYLVNKADFITYRTALRAIAVNPQSGNLTWPTKPSAIWG